MTAQVSPGVRTFAAFGLLVGLLLLLFNLAAPPVLHVWSTLDDETRTLRERAGEMRALSAGASAAGDAADQTNRMISTIAYIPGETEAVQLANLQTRIRGLAQRAGLRLQSTRTLATTRRQGVALVGLQVVAQTDITRLRDVLHAIETATPRLLVDALSVTPANRGSTSSPAEDLLNVDMRVLAAVRESRKGAAP